MRKVDLISGLPEFAFVNDIKACHHDVDTVFACFDNHKYGDYKPYVMKSTDRGATWEMITQGIPDRHLCWRIIQDHQKPELLFLGTEYGVYATINGGQNWFKFSHGLPVIPFRDLEIQRRENDLVGATFGRGFYVLDDYSPLRELDSETFDKPFHLFSIRDAKLFPQADFLGGQRGSQGNSFYIADNPPYGATFTYFLKEGFKSAKQKRKEAEEKAKQENAEVPFPTVEELAMESLEQTPELLFTIRDEQGDVVNRINAPLNAGMNRISWNLRTDYNALVVPGTYTVSVDQVHNGGVENLQEEMSFNVIDAVETTLPVEDKQEINEFYKAVYQLQRKIMAVNSRLEEANETLTQIAQAIEQDNEARLELLRELGELRVSHNKLTRKFSGQSNLQQKVGLDASPSLMQRVFNARGSIGSFAQPTQTHRDSFEIAQELYAELYPELVEFLDSQLKDFAQRVADAGVLGIPGSEIPDP